MPLTGSSSGRVRHEPRRVIIGLRQSPMKLPRTRKEDDIISEISFTPPQRKFTVSVYCQNENHGRAYLSVCTPQSSSTSQPSRAGGGCLPCRPCDAPRIRGRLATCAGQPTGSGRILFGQKMISCGQSNFTTASRPALTGIGIPPHSTSRPISTRRATYAFRRGRERYGRQITRNRLVGTR